MHTPPRQAQRILLVTAILVVLSSSVAHAQWVFVARKALKVINNIAGEIQSPGPGHAVDAATVLLEADADKVYAVAVRLLHENPEVRVLSEDAPRRAIAFTKGAQSASMKVSRLDDNLSRSSLREPPGNQARPRSWSRGSCESATRWAWSARAPRTERYPGARGQGCLAWGEGSYPKLSVSVQPARRHSCRSRAWASASSPNSAPAPWPASGSTAAGPRPRHRRPPNPPTVSYAARRSPHLPRRPIHAVLCSLPAACCQLPPVVSLRPPACCQLPASFCRPSPPSQPKRPGWWPQPT